MNQHDRRDLEVRNYVRNRMAGEIPPEFVSNVMNGVNRTPQRRRGPAWPIFGALATMAAAALAVVIGLNLVNSGGVGDQPSAPASVSDSAAPSASATDEPSASATQEPSLTPSAEPVPTEGEFGPIHSMTPEDAFANAQVCENPGSIVNGEPSDIGWRIAFPADWYTNTTGNEYRSACTAFGPVPFELGSDGGLPETVVIVADVPAGGDFSTDGEILATEQHTVDGVAAIRYEIGRSEAGFGAEDGILWVVAIEGGLPAVGNDRPYLIIGTGSNDPTEYAERVDILDRMIATLDLGAE